jgi:hypothetical protein
VANTDATELGLTPVASFSFEEKLRYLEEVFAWLDEQTSQFLSGIKAESAELRTQYTLFAEENRQLRDELIRDYRALMHGIAPRADTKFGGLR